MTLLNYFKRATLAAAIMIIICVFVMMHYDAHPGYMIVCGICILLACYALASMMARDYYPNTNMSSNAFMFSMLIALFAAFFILPEFIGFMALLLACIAGAFISLLFISLAPAIQ